MRPSARSAFLMEKTKIYETIQHEGVVQKVGSNSVLVTISSESACSGCHAEGFCNISGKEEKVVNVEGKYNVSPGDNVTILMKRSMGYKAVVLSYLSPLLIIIISLVVMLSLEIPELTAGIISILILVPYFLVLYLFRNQINKSFTFTLKT